MNNLPTPIWVKSANRWQLNVQHEKVRKTFTSSNPTKAGKAEVKRKAENWLDGFSERADWRLNKAFDAYLESMAGMVSPSMIAQRKVYGNAYILPELGEKKIGRITDADWQDVIRRAGNRVSEQTGRKLSKKTLQNIRAVIANFCKYAKASRMIIDVPQDLKIPRDAETMPKKVLQPQDMMKLFLPFDSRYIHLFRLEAVTGMRPGEVMGLKDDDVRDGIITIRRAITTKGTISKGKNNRARRSIVLSVLAQEIVNEQRAYLAEEGIESEWLFPNRWGEMPAASGVRKAWERWCELNGVECTLYGLRHSFVSLTKNNLPLALMKQQLGHSESMDTLKHYGHEIDGEMYEAAKIVDGVFSKILVHTSSTHSDAPDGKPDMQESKQKRQNKRQNKVD